ncbi:MAG: class I SAM-dependent methyltransferase [Sphingobacteriales bacterium]|nr:class I SAM-dependent methyltransferase [Sphingobacteriales bacterium]
MVNILFTIIRYPRTLNYILQNDLVWNKRLTNLHHLSNGFPVIQLEDIQSNFSETINTFSFLGGGSLPTDIALLKAVCKKFKRCSYFEIGTWRGESVVNVAEIADKCYTLNLSEDEILRRFKSKKYADLHGFFSRKNPKIIHLKGDSLEFNFASLNQKFDVVFIDGDHSFEAVKSDTKKVFKHLIHEKSVIIWHDYAYNPEMLRPEVICAIYEGTPKEFREHLYYVANTLCAIFIKDPFESFKEFEPFN